VSQQPQEVPDEQEEPAMTTSGGGTTPPDTGESYYIADHKLYAQQLYGQPSYLIDSAVEFAKLDPNEKHNRATIDAALKAVLRTPDKRFEEGQ
jgi:hypothetical protein